VDEIGGGHGIWTRRRRSQWWGNEGRKRDERGSLTFDDEALDLVTQQTHEPRHQHSSSRNTEDRVAAAAAAGFPRPDPRHCWHGTPLDENGIRGQGRVGSWGDSRGVDDARDGKHLVWNREQRGTGEIEWGQEERREAREDLTSFGISQIVNKDCLSRAEDCFIADLDTETKQSGTGDCWMTCGGDRRKRGGRDRGERGGRDRGKRGGRDRRERGGRKIRSYFPDQMIITISNQSISSICRDRHYKRNIESRDGPHSICGTSGAWGSC
jgi:hypothetical protein